MKTSKSTARARKLKNQVKECYSTWGDTYYQAYYSSKAAYPPVHRTLIQKLLKKKKVRRLLDAGCGPASLLRDIDRKIDRYGFDLTPEMVAEAQRILTKQGIAPHKIWQGSVLTKRSFTPPGKRVVFDAAMCVGVLPHIRPADDRVVAKNLYNAVRPGGTVIVEARNELFGMFTLNRYSLELMLNRLIAPPTTPKAVRPQLEKMVAGIEKFYRADLPPIRRGSKGEPGYDEILSRTHNPLELQEVFRKVGFTNLELHFYHFHCVPPMFAERDPRMFRKESIRRESSQDWRGLFQASAFLLVGDRP